MLAPDWFSGFDKLFGCQWIGYRVIYIPVKANWYSRPSTVLVTL